MRISVVIAKQSTNEILMVRPARFYPNPETAADNTYQQTISPGAVEEVTRRAQGEFDSAVQTLRAAGVTVHVVEDTATPEKPDAVFPNNWFSTHHDGRVALYPMYSAVRRRERRYDVIDLLRQFFRISEVIDYSSCEEEGRCLEGTGSLVLDHPNSLAYASLSQRTHPKVLERFCRDFGFQPVTFTSESEKGQPIYHTNVMMCVGTDLALLGAETIPDEKQRENVRSRLQTSGKDLIELSRQQIGEFAGNAIELEDTGGDKLLVMSARAQRALTPEQRLRIEKHSRIVALELPTIELGGGSARCMIATIHLPPR